jgi:DNA primase
MSAWVDFKQLRQLLSFHDVLRYYKVEVKTQGRQHHGFCPLPKHGGQKRSPSFSANLDRGIFQCFGCGARGNVLEFAALMEGIDLNDGTALREVAVKLQEHFCPTVQRNASEAKTPPTAEPKTPEKSDEAPAIVNEPLDFELKGLDPAHPYLLGRGFTPDTIKHFGLGYCSRGLLTDRVAIPLCDGAGKLIGYAGRVVDDSTIGEGNPRYRFPGKRSRGDRSFEFRKTLFLYNGFRIKEPLDDLVVVEGFTSVWWLHQNSLPHVVATMGSDCSDEQAKVIIAMLKPSGRAWIIPDGDPAGERFAQSLLMQISPHRFVRWVKLPADKQPTDLSGDELRTCFGSQP